MLVDGEKKSEHFRKKKKHTLIEGRGDEGLFVATATLQISKDWPSQTRIHGVCILAINYKKDRVGRKSSMGEMANNTTRTS